MKANVVTFENKAAGTIDLDEGVFGLPSRPDVLHQVVRWQLAKRQAGTHKTKGISEVRGTTAKPFRQKGTGRARRGSNRATQFRGGGIVFGPVVRSHGHSLNKKVRVLGLKTALSDKQREGKLVIVDQATMKDAKTGGLSASLKKLGLTSALVIDGATTDENFLRAAANIAEFDVLPAQGANVYDIMRRDTLVLTKAAVDQLKARLS
jgi:large subunit ribosomal protein L4